MANTFELITSTTVGSGGAADITFSSIPSTYTDLCLKLSARTNAAGDTYDNLKVYPNGATTNLSSRYLGSYSGTTVFSATSTAGIIANAADGASATASTFANTEIYIPNYAGSTNKSMSVDAVAETNAADGRQGLTAFLWSNTAAITSLQIVPSAGTSFNQYSTAYLYGVKNA